MKGMLDKFKSSRNKNNFKTKIDFDSDLMKAYKIRLTELNYELEKIDIVLDHARLNNYDMNDPKLKLILSCRKFKIAKIRETKKKIKELK